MWNGPSSRSQWWWSTVAFLRCKSEKGEAQVFRLVSGHGPGWRVAISDAHMRVNVFSRESEAAATDRLSVVQEPNFALCKLRHGIPRQPGVVSIVSDLK